MFFLASKCQTVGSFPEKTVKKPSLRQEDGTWTKKSCFGSREGFQMNRRIEEWHAMTNVYLWVDGRSGKWYLVNMIFPWQWKNSPMFFPSKHWNPALMPRLSEGRSGTNLEHLTRAMFWWTPRMGWAQGRLWVSKENPDVCAWHLK